MNLVIAEKPSVARSIASILGADNKESGYMEGNGWIVSWCLGHLVQYAEPETYGEQYKNKWDFNVLPIIPEIWKTVVSEDKKDQFGVLQRLLNRTDIDYVVNACDAGREGELIFYQVYSKSNSHIPMRRLWVSSMEDSAIKYAFEHLADGSKYDNLRSASICRAKADWLVGMNGSRAYSSKYGRSLSVGRVQTPTLAMLVERQKKIDEFVSEPYWTVSLSADGLTVSSDRLDDEGFADALQRLCDGKDGTVLSAERVKKKTRPPKLYDLTTLQREANRAYGYTAQKTLDIAQSLYEGKMITYPRTDSQYITDDMQDTVLQILKQLPGKVPFLSGIELGNNVARLVDNSKVSDHTALLPTIESLKHDLSSQPEEHRNIYYLICSKLAQATSVDCEYEDIKVVVTCENHEFKASGKTILKSGWREVLNAFSKTLHNSEQEKEQSIPDWVVQDAVMKNVVAVKDQHMTTPPKPYTEDTLLSAMETAGNKEFNSETEKKGLGTPATRAAIIERLIKANYAERKKKTIIPTERGKSLIAVVSDTVKSPSMTAEWENQLLQMEHGQINPDVWMDGIYNLINNILSECRNLSYEELNRFNEGQEVVGTCPICGKPVNETPKSFRCSGYLDNSCNFTLWKDNAFLKNMKKQIDKKAAKELLANGRTHMTGLYSKKTGKTFDADLVLEVNSDSKYVTSFKLDFNNNNNSNNSNNSNSDNNNSQGD